MFDPISLGLLLFGGKEFVDWMTHDDEPTQVQNRPDAPPQPSVDLL